MELKKVKVGAETKYELSDCYHNTPVLKAIKECGGHNAAFAEDFYDDDWWNTVEVVFYAKSEITLEQIQMSMRIIELEQKQHTHWWKRSAR